MTDFPWRYAAAPQNGWFLLDTMCRPDIVKQFKEHFEEFYPWDQLFADTPLHEICEQGPLLVRMSAGSPLSQAMPYQWRVWPGLVIICSASKQQLLAHLRRMLTVQYGEHYSCVLTYYNVQTASYFFDAMDAEELSTWLGPIESLTWYGGPWADKVDGTQGRQFVINPRLEVPPLAANPQLSQKQKSKLQQCLLERLAYTRSCAAGTDYRQTLHHVHEGLSLEFTNNTVLDHWLVLRGLFPLDAIPAHLSGASQQARLETLTNYWQSGRS